MQKITYKGVSFLLPPPGEKTNSRDVGMQYWFADNQRAFFTYFEHVWFGHKHVMNAIGNGQINLFEVYAGIGASSAFLKPIVDKQVGVDHNEDAIRAYNSRHPLADGILADTYSETPKQLALNRFDYILYEHSAITMYRAMTEQKELALQKAIWKHGARFVLFVDSCKSKEHLHYKRYSEFFCEEMSDNKSYVNGVSRWANRMFGYSIVACAADGINYSMLFEKDAPVTDIDVVDSRALVDMTQLKVVDDKQFELNFG